MDASESTETEMVAGHDPLIPSPSLERSRGALTLTQGFSPQSAAPESKPLLQTIRLQHHGVMFALCQAESLGLGYTWCQLVRGTELRPPSCYAGAQKRQVLI